ncbi:MAG: HD domain-containing phosphohydrolase [Candidatus Acidiferrales bacterium]
MPQNDRPRILCVDDEPNVLEGLSRTLRAHYEVETAVGGRAALEMLKAPEPFAIVMSDQRMPQMDGVHLLAHVRAVSPATVRVLLTGQADMESAIAAVNEGNIFRFLTKPCPSDVLLKALDACCEQYRLVTSEKVLLEQTLRGSIKALVDILSLSNPTAFGRATRVRQTVEQLMNHFAIRERWSVEVAAMLSQIGCVTLPPATLDKLYRGETLEASEQEMVDRMPAVAEKCLSNIPRIDSVREILHQSTRPFGEAKQRSDAALDVEMPWGARALKIALDFDLLESEANSSDHPFAIMRGRKGCYDPRILDALAAMRGNSQEKVQMLELSVREVAVGMVFGEDLKSSKGLLLIARGQEVTPALLERMRNFSPELAIREPVRMFLHNPAAAGAQPVLADSRT